jgi:cell wall-associated NlpC family hydrolase
LTEENTFTDGSAVHRLPPEDGSSCKIVSAGFPGFQSEKEVVLLHTRQKKPKQGGQKTIVRVMAILLALMFVLSLGSQILLYAGAEDLGTSGELKARHEALSQQREEAQQKLDELAERDHSAAERYERIAFLDETVSAQIEVDTKLLQRSQDECMYLNKARKELLTAAKDEEVVLECGQEELDSRRADVENQLAQKQELVEQYSARLEAEQSDLADLEAALDEVTRELNSDDAYREEVQELSKTDESLEADVLSEETQEAVKRAPLRAAESGTDRKETGGGAAASSEKVKGADVAAFAVRYLGSPYKWGGDSLTEGCDCSGFIKAVFSNFGIDLPHFSGSLQHAGSDVEYEDAQLGDLICYDGHVGIYLGEDKMVNAFDSEHGVIVCSVNVSRLVTVRRIV